jgi:hypothetical protein
VKTFAGDPRVVTAILSDSETPDVLQTFWSNLYLRGRMIVDPDGRVASGEFAQPATGLPFGRLFVLTQDRTVELPLFGYNPQRVVDVVRDLLARTRLTLLAEPASAALGEPVAFTCYGGVVDAPDLVFVVGAGGEPCWVQLCGGAFDERGVHAESHVADDPLLVGQTFQCQALGFQEHDGRLALSNVVEVTVE